MLSSLCRRALKYLSISLYLAIGVGSMWHTSEIWKWSPFPQRSSFSLFRFCIFPSAICQFYVFLLFFHPTLKTEDHLLRKGILPHTLLTFYFWVANIQVKSDPVLARIWYSALPHSRLRSLPLFSKHLVSRYSLNLWNSRSGPRTEVVVIITSHMHILGSKPKLHLNKNKLFHPGNQMGWLAIANLPSWTLFTSCRASCGICGLYSTFHAM